MTMMLMVVKCVDCLHQMADARLEKITNVLLSTYRGGYGGCPLCGYSGCWGYATASQRDSGEIEAAYKLAKAIVTELFGVEGA